ncbi:MAG: HAD-IC family P-type ATPase, partial [Oscillospiraceae bacterium]|nr:HAD-IC family P-type ATPase [Oscillospiraceae bacterium]
KTVMLTGDRKLTGETVAAEVGIDEVHTELLPDGKVALVEELYNSKAPRSTLVFVGDGMNDAPALARADVGIAMGGQGSDAAIEAADIVLMNDNIEKLPVAVKIARKTHSIVMQNIVFALGVKVLVLILSALGLANMWAAVFADVGVSVIAILNAMRAMRS